MENQKKKHSLHFIQKLLGLFFVVFCELGCFCVPRVRAENILTTYDSASNPALSGQVSSVSFESDHHLVYASTWGNGLSVINTQGTTDPSDDTLVVTYDTGSSPALASNNVHSVSFDAPHNLVYVNTEGGLSVINTQGTTDPSDDTLVVTYDTGSSPALVNNDVTFSLFDEVSHMLYVGTWGGGVSVINTQNTHDPSDDVLVTTYTTSTTPSIVTDYISGISPDTVNNLLYISTGGGLSVIDTQGTTDPSDDTSGGDYTETSSPALSAADVSGVYVDSARNLLSHHRRSI